MIEFHKHNGSSVYQKMIFAIILFEYLLFVFSGVSFWGLSGAVYYDVITDPVYWLFFLTGMPQYIIGHEISGLIFDLAIIIILLFLIFKGYYKFLVWLLFVLLLIYYVTLTSYLGHRNYQSGFVLMVIPFLFSESTNRSFAFDGVRYFYLFFYFSSGVFKIINLDFDHTVQFSNILKNQFIPYYLESSHNWRTTLHSFLIQHQQICHVMYYSVIIFEIVFLTGFFTKRVDFLFGIVLVFFHFSNWIVMDISPIGQLSVIFFFLKKPS